MATQEKMRDELHEALALLDRLSTEAQGETNVLKENMELKKKLEFLQEANEELAKKKDEHLQDFTKEKKERDKLSSALEELTDMSGRLQTDIIRVAEEKQQLTDIVKHTQAENDVLSKVMDKISCDYENLKKTFESQKCPKDDKITALRNTARALESENELLQEEKRLIERENIQTRRTLEDKIKLTDMEAQQLRDQILAQEAEKKSFLEKFERLEQEKINVMRQLVKVEKELDQSSSHSKQVLIEKEKIMSEKLDVMDTLAALKEGKRVVENKLHSVLLEKSSLTQSKSLLEVKNTSLEERLHQLEYQNLEQSDILASLQQNLIEQTSEYESKMNEMQEELDKRLDEINNSKNEDVEDIKTHYLTLFNEKASEVMNVRGELDECEESLESFKHKCKDLEYREQELNEIINKLRQSKDDSVTQVDVETYITHTKANTDIITDKLTFLKKKFDILKANEYSGRQQLVSQIDQMRNMICDKDIQIFELQQKAKMDQKNNKRLIKNHILDTKRNASLNDSDISDAKFVDKIHVSTQTNVILPQPQPILLHSSSQANLDSQTTNIHSPPSHISLPKNNTSSSSTNISSSSTNISSLPTNITSPQISDIPILTNKNIPKNKDECDNSVEQPVESCSLEDNQCDNNHSKNTKSQNKNKRKKKKKKAQSNQF